MSVSASEASDDDDFSQYAPGHMPMPDFEALARDIQNQASRRVGAATTETRHFREFFGTSVLVVKKTWELLERDSLLPEGGRPKHLLWALHFMKVYPKQSPGCLAVGASAGAVDPKTHRKWVWAFIDAVANLDDVVVSNHSVRTSAEVILAENVVGQLRSSKTDVDGDDGSPRCSRRAHSNKHSNEDVYALIFFFQHPVLTSPADAPPRKRRSTLRADWARTTCSTTA